MPDWGGGLKGAGGGALAGASVGGPIGALIGGGIGGLAGLFGGGPSEEEQANRARLEEFYKSTMGRQAPQAQAAGPAGYSAFRDNQRNLVSHLEGMSRGMGPSLAAEQMKAATDRNVSQQQAFANSGRGGPLAAQLAAVNSARLGAQASQDAGTARIAEQQMALNQLGLTLHGARGADEEMGRFNTGQANEMAQANLAARLKTMGMNDDAVLRALGQLGGQAANESQRPGFGDQMLAGGAGAFSQYAAQQAAAKNAGGSASYGGAMKGWNDLYGNPFGGKRYS